MSKNKPKTKNVVIKEKKEINVGAIIIIIIAIIITIILSLLIYKSYVNSHKKTEEPQAIKVDDAIDKYGYELVEHATGYYKDLFNRLKILLNTEGFDEAEYAKLVAQMFAADFYNLDNKLTNSDIGGLSFVFKDNQTNFKLAAQNGMYNSVQNNIYNDRDQKLPKVTEVEIKEIVNTTFHNDTQAYKIKVGITYEEKLGYPENVELILIHNDNKLEIAKVG